MQRCKHVLGVVDLISSTQTVLERAVSLAQNNQAILTVVCVIPKLTLGTGMPEGGPVSSQLQQAAVADMQHQLDEAIAPFQPQIDIKSKVLVGTPFLEIIRDVLRYGNDLVIKAPENPDWLTRLFGSDDMHLLRKCPCPVWLVKHMPSTKYRRILAAIDVDDDHPDTELTIRHGLNTKVLELAISFALADFSELHVVHAWQAINETIMRGTLVSLSNAQVDDYIEQVRISHEKSLDNLLNDLSHGDDAEAAKYLKPKKHMIKGLPQEVIPALAKRLDVDLVVMGTVARTGVSGLFIGNTAETILEQIQCSVLAVKPEGFKTPVSIDV